MIRYFDTEAAYLAAVQDAESRVSLVGESNACKFDGRNVIVGIDSATTGSIAYLDDNKALRFVATSTFNKDTFPASYEIVGVTAIGVDHPDFRGEVGVMHYNFINKALLTRYTYKLSGYTLDGAEHSGVLSIRSASDNWAANKDYTIVYKADNIVALISQLNDYFKSNEPFIAQDWVAIADTNDDVLLHFNYTAWQQTSNNTAKSGFTIAAKTAPQWVPVAGILKMNGERSNNAIMNMPRALAYFRKDTSVSSYNPTIDVTATNLKFPICLPGYLGTSKYQSDHCAYLRGIYGEGEEGWLKFMQSFLPVFPQEYGVFNDRTAGTAKQNTNYLANLKFTGQDGVEKYASPAARFVVELGFEHERLKHGEWVIPKMSQVFSVICQLQYPATSDNNYADKINAALAAIGAPALSNGANIWSSDRSDDKDALFFNGTGGFANDNNFYNPYLSFAIAFLPRQRNDNV